MKSKTSCFNGVIFRKNLTRFAPVWCLYTLCLLLGMFLMLDSNIEYWFAANLASMCSGMALINMGYALLTAQLLFGDLYNTRMCNALHALPLRRECWFTTNVVSGLVFSLIPTAIMAAASELFLVNNPTMVNGWQIPLYFFAAANLEYLFFFALAVFAVFCAGNRLGMAVIYAIINFATYLAYFLVDTLITPMYYGAVTDATLYGRLCPVAHLSGTPLIECQHNKEMGDLAAVTGEDYVIRGTFRLTEAWLYVGILVVLALVLLLIARQLYRRRKLECAGDMLSTRKLEPVFMVAFAITVGTVFQFVPNIFYGLRQELPVFLFIGIVVGWFVGRMLLERQTNVFGRVKNWLGCVILTSAVVGVLFGLSMDPFGVEDYVPDAADVKRAVMRTSYRGVLDTEDPGEIADVIRIQQGILEEKLTGEEANKDLERVYKQALELPEVQSNQISADAMAEKIGYRRFGSIEITYELKNGLTVIRDYWLWMDTEAAQLAEPYFSRLDALFYHSDDIETPEDLMKLVRAPEYLYVDGRLLPEDFLTADNVRSLFEAVIADCEAGTMAQTDGFHEEPVVNTPNRFQWEYHVEVNLVEHGLYFNVYSDSENCMRWLEETGIRDYIMEHSIIG